MDNIQRRNIQITHDAEGKSIVLINDIIFKGKRDVKWEDVEKYMKQDVGEFYTIAETSDVIYIGSDLPDEYAHSAYTATLKGSNAKATANAAQGLGEMLEIAVKGNFTHNTKEKHKIDAANGWYRYESRFGLPVYDADGELERYNIFHAYMIIRHDKNGSKYLYDVINIKKETSTPPDCQILTSTV